MLIFTFFNQKKVCSLFQFLVFLNKKQGSKNTLFVFLFLLPLSSYTIPVSSFIPDEINTPSQLKNRTSEQIQAVFASLEKQHSQKTANLWKLKYHKALLLKKKNTDSFCSIMKELAEAPAFPLKDLALIQSYELCPYPEEPKFDPERFPEWLRLKLAKAFYKRRKSFKNPEQTLESAIYLAQNSPYKELKISYLKHALSLAKEQKQDQTAAKLSELLYKEAPRFKQNPGIKDYFLIAEDLKQNRKFKGAIVFYIKLLNSFEASFEEKNLSFKALDRIYKIQKSNKKKIINSRQWSNWLLRENTKQSLAMYYNRQLDLAKQQWNLNENQKAIQLVTNILQEPKSEPIREEALYLRGLIYVQEKKPELSLMDWDNVVKILRKKKSNSRLLEKVLWKRGWLFRSQKSDKQALDNFRFLEKITKNQYTKYKVLFWKGKTLQDLGQKTLAKRSFKLLIKKDHFGYYGLLAHKILNKKPIFQKREKLSKLIHFSVDKTVENLIHWLVLFEESDLLSQFLDTQENEFLNQKKHTEQEWLKMISLWVKAKKYLTVFQSIEKMDDSVQASFFKKHTHLLFPLEFSEDVEQASKKWNIPKAFVFAILRQESAFNTRARSPADAFGLMQLIPSTARQTAREFKIAYKHFRELYRPSKNILLGTAHLKSLLGRYNNSFLLSVAAYNAGGTPIEKWKEDMKNLEPLEFIENIPYEETRTYLRLIIRNYIFYHNELNSEEAWFPDWILQ